MKGIPDHMYICWRKSYTERQIEETLAGYFKMCLIPILTQLAFDPRKVARYKYSQGELINLVVKEIREYQTQVQRLRKEMRTLRENQSTVKQLVFEYMDKHHNK